MSCKALTQEEVQSVLTNLMTKRDRALFILGLRTGFRISELLSLKVSDVWSNSMVKTSVTVSRANMKGKIKARSVVLHSEAVQALTDLVSNMMVKSDMPLFGSQKGNLAITRSQAHRILATAHNKAGLVFKGTHTMRKTLALKVYSLTNKDLLLTQKALGHKLITSTIAYLPIDQDKVDAAILA